MGALGPGALCGGVRGGGSPPGKNAKSNVVARPFFVWLLIAYYGGG